MDATTRHLVEFTLDARTSKLAPAVVHECKRRLIDTLGCAVGAFDDPLSVVIRELADETTGKRSATVWGTSKRSSLELATFANGTMLRVHDFNDTYFALDGAHPSDILSAILAAAETTRADGATLLTAVATGYEIFCRFMQSLDVGVRNYDQCVYASAAAALAVGQLMGLSPTQLVHALSLSIAPNLPLRQTRKGDLSHWKGCASANAARNAIFAAELAARGVTGPSEIFEGKQGLWSVMGEFHWAAPEDWSAMASIQQTYLKSLATCYHAQAAAQAAIELHPKVRAQDVESIAISAYEEAVRMIGSDPSRWAPQSRETADHSLPFIVATCLVEGKVGPASFDDDKLFLPELANLMRRTRVEAEERMTAQYPEAAPARVTVRTRNGDTLTAEVTYPKGHRSDPMNDSELVGKFTQLAGGRSAASERILGAIWNIETCADATASMLPHLATICAEKVLTPRLAAVS